jgi:hypothetical protein
MLTKNKTRVKLKVTFYSHDNGRTE